VNATLDTVIQERDNLRVAFENLEESLRKKETELIAANRIHAQQLKKVTEETSSKQLLDKGKSPHPILMTFTL